MYARSWHTLCLLACPPAPAPLRLYVGLMVDELKRTYEVIGENGCRSYRLEDIPLYSNVIAELKEGIYLEANELGDDDDDDEEEGEEAGGKKPSKSGKASRRSKKSKKSGKSSKK